ncbi:MAG: hypothetical protein ACHP9Y_02000 [Gammaproteobacteria bacterium]
MPLGDFIDSQLKVRGLIEISYLDGDKLDLTAVANHAWGEEIQALALRLEQYLAPNADKKTCRQEIITALNTLVMDPSIQMEADAFEHFLPINDLWQTDLNITKKYIFLLILTHALIQNYFPRNDENNLNKAEISKLFAAFFTRKLGKDLIAHHNNKILEWGVKNSFLDVFLFLTPLLFKGWGVFTIISSLLLLLFSKIKLNNSYSAPLPITELKIPFMEEPILAAGDIYRLVDSEITRLIQITSATIQDDESYTPRVIYPDHSSMANFFGLFAPTLILIMLVALSSTAVIKALSEYTLSTYVGSGKKGVEEVLFQHFMSHPLLKIITRPQVANAVGTTHNASPIPAPRSEHIPKTT